MLRITSFNCLQLNMENTVYFFFVFVFENYLLSIFYVYPSLKENFFHIIFHLPQMIPRKSTHLTTIFLRKPALFLVSLSRKIIFNVLLPCFHFLTSPPHLHTLFSDFQTSTLLMISLRRVNNILQ